MRALISFVTLSLFLYLGYYVYTHLSPEEQQKVQNIGKEGLDKAGDVATKGAKEVLKHVGGTSQPTPAPAPGK